MQDPSIFPKDGQIIASMMKSMGIVDCEPQVIPLLLELMYRHSTDTLRDASLFSQHTGKKEIDIFDLRYVIQIRATHTYMPAPSKEVMLEIATQTNVKPFPLISTDRYIHLPPDELCMYGQQSHILSTPISKQH